MKQELKTDQMAEIQKERTLLDAKFLNDGAEYRFDNEYNYQLFVTDKQEEEIAKTKENFENYIKTIINNETILESAGNNYCNLSYENKLKIQNTYPIRKVKEGVKEGYLNQEEVLSVIKDGLNHIVIGVTGDIIDLINRRVIPETIAQNLRNMFLDYLEEKETLAEIYEIIDDKFSDLVSARARCYGVVPLTVKRLLEKY
ncbi:MAG: hypothetical protein WC850_02500 [Candidatus Gracilibacteria bacterium]